MRLRTSPIMLVVSIVTTILASTFLLDSGATQDALTAKEFERDLRKAHSLMKRKRWAKAREAFAKLLVEHREKPWVYAKRTELVADIKQCVFRIQVPEPKADDVVTGDLERWDARTGKLRVRYTPDNRGDIEAGEVQTHPLRFEGPYTVTFKGKRWPDNTNLVPMAFVFLDSNRTYRFSLGIEKQTDGASTRWLDCELMRFEGDRKKVLAQKDKTPLKSGKSFTVKIKVGSTSMSASGGGGSFLRGKKPRGVFGSIGFANIPWDEMVLEGKGDPGWIRSELNKATRKQRAKFEKSWKPDQEIPKWLVTPAAASSDPREGLSDADYPVTPKKTESTHIRVLNKHARSRRSDAGLRYLERSEARDLSPVLRHFYRALFQFFAGHHEKALVDCRVVCKANPKFAETRTLEIHLLARLRRFDEAVVAANALVDEFPRAAYLYRVMTDLLMVNERLPDARAIATKAASRNVRSKRLDATLELLVKAERGPPWSKKYEATSTHYHVVSDIDKKTCREATVVLEQAYRAYSVQLDWVRSTGKKRRFKVYIFSGEDGYLDYSKGVLGSIPVHSAGLYSSVLKQLLIWNLPDREAMFRTVRHEGFHQFLDSILAEEAPRWLDEGMAEYYETADSKSGSFKGGQTRTDHLKELARGDRIIPLKKFLYEPPGDFYKDASRHYAQGWGMVHFLLHGGAERRQVWKRLFEPLLDGKTAEQALESAFGPIDVAAFEKEFVAYLKSMK